jgi:hypothetical protein
MPDDNRPMRRISTVVLACATALAACTPTFNWREVRTEGGGLKAMMPCKPDKSERAVPMAGHQVSLQVMGCNTGGATFAILFADMGDPARAGEVLGQWKTATVSNLHSAAIREAVFRPTGAAALAQSLQVVATGERVDGSKVESHAAYFARGSHVFQAVIYADQLEPEVAETFFSGLVLE